MAIEDKYGFVAPEEWEFTNEWVNGKDRLWNYEDDPVWLTELRED